MIYTTCIKRNMLIHAYYVSEKRQKKQAKVTCLWEKKQGNRKKEDTIFTILPFCSLGNIYYCCVHVTYSIKILVFKREKRGQISPNPVLCSLSTPSPFSASAERIQRMYSLYFIVWVLK